MWNAPWMGRCMYDLEGQDCSQSTQMHLPCSSVQATLLGTETNKTSSHNTMFLVRLWYTPKAQLLISSTCTHFHQTLWANSNSSFAGCITVFKLLFFWLFFFFFLSIRTGNNSNVSSCLPSVIVVQDLMKKCRPSLQIKLQLQFLTIIRDRNRDIIRDRNKVTSF